MAKQAEKSNKKTTKGAQKTGSEAPETPPDPENTPPPASDGPPETGEDKVPETPPEGSKTPKRYVFPRQGNIKCPGCGLYETVATGTHGAIQSRKCTRAIPVCRHTFKITGTEVKIPDCKQDS